jgi:hypothetical protein
MYRYIPVNWGTPSWFINQPDCLGPKSSTYQYPFPLCMIPASIEISIKLVCVCVYQYILVCTKNPDFVQPVGIPDDPGRVLALEQFFLAEDSGQYDAPHPGPRSVPHVQAGAAESSAICYSASYRQIGDGMISRKSCKFWTWQSRMEASWFMVSSFSECSMREENGHALHAFTIPTFTLRF